MLARQGRPNSNRVQNGTSNTTPQERSAIRQCLEGWPKKVHHHHIVGTCEANVCSDAESWLPVAGGTFLSRIINVCNAIAPFQVFQKPRPCCTNR